MIQITDWSKPKQIVNGRHYIDYLEAEKLRLKAQGRNAEIKSKEGKEKGHQVELVALFADKV